MLYLAILRYIVHNTHMMNDLISKGVCYHLEFSSPANLSSNTYSYYVETSLLTIALFSIMKSSNDANFGIKHDFWNYKV